MVENCKTSTRVLYRKFGVKLWSVFQKLKSINLTALLKISLDNILFKTCTLLKLSTDIAEDEKLRLSHDLEKFNLGLYFSSPCCTTESILCLLIKLIVLLRSFWSINERFNQLLELLHTTSVRTKSGEGYAFLFSLFESVHSYFRQLQGKLEENMCILNNLSDIERRPAKDDSFVRAV